MAVVFYYVFKENIDKLKEGIKISRHYEKVVDLGEKTPCIVGLLSPRDDAPKYKSKDYVCIELEVDPERCFVLDSDLDFVEEKGVYEGSAVRLSSYKFGTYRRPEVLITEDISPDKITIPKKGRGTPVIFDTSDNLYKGILFEELRLRYNDFDETLLGIFFMLMVSKGKFKLLGSKKANGKTVYVYQDNSSGKVYTLDIKEVEK